MKNKLLFALIGAFGLLCVCTANPVDKSSEESSENGVKEYSVERRLELLAFSTQALGSMYETFLDKGKTMFENVLEDPKIVEHDSKAMEKYRKKITKFLKQLEEAEKKSSEKTASAFELIDDFGNLLNEFMFEGKTQLSEEEELLKKSFEANGIIDFQKMIHKKFEGFTENFVKEIEKYTDNLNEKGRKEEADLIAWKNKYKAQTTFEGKVEMFEKLFDASGEDK